MPTYVATPTTQLPGPASSSSTTSLARAATSKPSRLARRRRLSERCSDLYYWGSRLRCLHHHARHRRGRGRTFDDVEAVRPRLTAHEGCSAIGVIGFCMGGGYALALAPRTGILASSVNYGGCPKDAEQVLAGACPIVGSYGGKDRLSSVRAPPFGSRVRSRRWTCRDDVKVYPEAGHGFMNDHDPADQTALLVALAGRLGDAVPRTLVSGCPPADPCVLPRTPALISAPRRLLDRPAGPRRILLEHRRERRHRRTVGHLEGSEKPPEPEDPAASTACPEG